MINRIIEFSAHNRFLIPALAAANLPVGKTNVPVTPRVKAREE